MRAEGGKSHGRDLGVNLRSAFRGWWKAGVSAAYFPSKKCTHGTCNNKDPLTATKANTRVSYYQIHFPSSRACTSSGIGIDSSAQISSASWLGEG